MKRVFASIVRLPGLLLILLIRLYQKTLSPVFGQSCRFTPTCSCYMIEAVQKYGAVRGFVKGVFRIARCHPWNQGGHDPP